jgi:Na+/H+ antiporter NhaD/arsenite permease-like protein
MCLVLTPLVLDVTAQLQRKPTPYLLAVAMASNIGSVATITGNPQNMLIGNASHIPYRAFAAALAPLALAGLVLTVLLLVVGYRRELFDHAPVEIVEQRVRVDRKLLWKSLAAAALMIGLFFAGWSVPKTALVTGAVLLFTRRVKPEKVYREIDWSLLVLFLGLFIVLAGMEKTTVAQDLERWATQVQLDHVGLLTLWAAALSNVVSNVPAVLLFKPLIPVLPHPTRAWLVLAMASTLAGNLTLVGSLANLIVVERARRQVRITFLEHLRVGPPLTAASLLVGVLLLR